MTDAPPQLPAFAALAVQYGYQVRSRSYSDLGYWAETVGVDDVAFIYTNERGAETRRVSLGGRFGPHDFTLSDLLVRLGEAPTHGEADWLVAAARLDKATIARLTTS